MHRHRFHAAMIGLLWTFFAPSVSQTETTTSLSREDIKQQLADQISRDFQLPRDYVLSALRKARFHQDIIDRINRPYEARPYAQYRPLFVNRRLARMGKRYLEENHEIFSRVRKRYGVQPEIIAAILGMETKYGRSKGRDRVLDALYTLATGHPRRSAFFQKELGHFLSMCREEELIPEKLLGSYAGAFGTTQFIPSSFRHFAIDADGDGKRDVWDSSPDIISSVGNYFREHGWKAGQPVAYWLPKLPHHPLLDELRKKGITMWKPLKNLRSIGLPALPKIWRDDAQVSLVDFETSSGTRTALIHYNFYVITRWNRSYNYAMAVTELAERLGCIPCRSH